MGRRLGLTLLLGLACAGGAARSAEYEEFRIKRKEVFEFSKSPRLTRQGDRVEIRFTAKDFCDVTIAIEDPAGRIVRHLASGVLGPNAPAPLQKSSLVQTVLWDGKDETGRYLDDKEALSIRVSLGLNPRYEKTLYWEPKKRLGSGGGMGASPSRSIPVPLMQPAPEGVYVFEGCGVDRLQLFDHDGNYVRTLYPFPAHEIDKAQVVTRHTFPQDGLTLPFKVGYTQATLLTSGSSASLHHGTSRFGSAATAMAVRNGRVALLLSKLNRLATDGSTGGLPLEGPKVTLPARMAGGSNRSGKEALQVNPTSAALSPDGKRLYLTGYLWRDGIPGINLVKDGLPCVVRMDYEGDAEPVLFAGSLKQEETGSDAAHLKDPVSVDCDSQGRVYVADFMNDRVQVYAPDGKLLKSLATPKPARVFVHPKSGEIHVFSWCIQNDSSMGVASQKASIRIDPTLTSFGPLERPERKATVALPFVDYAGKYHGNDKWGGLQFSAVLDPWASSPTLWVVSGTHSMDYVSGGGTFVEGKSNWERWNVRLHTLKGRETPLKRDFGDEVTKSVAWHKPATYLRQRLYVNPKNRKLYLAEQHNGLGKSFDEILEIDPATGQVRKLRLPMDSEDLAFDLNGLIYLRSLLDLARFEPETWREVPFDYGEERAQMAYSSSSQRRASVLSAIPLYAGTLWHKGGLWVSPKGHIAVSCYSTKDDMPHINMRTDAARIGGGSEAKAGEKSVHGAAYVPRFFAGRNYYGQIHIFDKHGHRICDDEVPGIAITDGLFIDQEDSVYVMAGSTRVFGGKTYFSDFTGTLMKFRQGQGRILSNERTPVPLTSPPARPPDISGTVQGKAWVEGAEWMYGGVGYAGRAAGSSRMGGITCACCNTRFALDYFARSFAPEFDRYKVAVLDSNGNLILRIGQYGNVDDGAPLVPAGAPLHPRPLGGDEVALIYPVYVATDTDRRLFIADPGNQRIVSVKLDYHATERASLRGVPDTAAQARP